jgi:hypothetical protein
MFNRALQLWQAKVHGVLPMRQSGTDGEIRRYRTLPPRFASTSSSQSARISGTEDSSSSV